MTRVIIPSPFTLPRPEPGPRLFVSPSARDEVELDHYACVRRRFDRPGNVRTLDGSVKGPFLADDDDRSRGF